MTEYVTRVVDVHVLPLGKVTLLHPERCVLQFGNQTIDVGALCYRRRSNRLRGGKQKSRLVDLNSLEQTRVDKLRKLISHLSLVAKSGGKEMVTLHAQAYDHTFFVDWCDENGHKGMFGTEQDARHAFRTYVDYLRHRVDTDDLNVNTAATHQNYTAGLLGALFGIDDITRGVRLLQKSRNATKVTSPPDEGSQGKVLSLCQSIFNGVTTHVLDHNPYPFRLPVPNYLGWKVSYLWLFPTNKAFMAPHELARRDELAHGNWSNNYTEGRLATVEEIRSRYSTEHHAKADIQRRKLDIDTANRDSQGGRRRELAICAHNAFVLLFTANTGMNWAEVRKLPWGTDYEVGTESQGFREIKFRASGKPVSFQIEAGFLPTFKRYLELRAYLLNGKKFCSLFFSLGMRAAQRPRPVGVTMLSSLLDTLRRIDPLLPQVLTRKWRAAKSDWLIRYTDPATTALILQNTEHTVLQHYTAGSETRAIEEIGLFYEKLSDVVLDAGQALPANSIGGALGKCTQYGSPKPTEEAPPIMPDCHQTEGCLFCERYVVHADERDARKLISCRTCLYRTTHLSASEEHFQSLFGEVLRRIDAILRAIGEKSDDHAKLIERVRIEVEDEGQLDAYWEKKMQMLTSLGVVSQ